MLHIKCVWMVFALNVFNEFDKFGLERYIIKGYRYLQAVGLFRQSPLCQETNQTNTPMEKASTNPARIPVDSIQPHKPFHFINPFTDVGFKRIFGQEVNKDLLMDFLNELLAGEERIEDLRFMDKEQLPDNEQERGIIYDIFCRTEDGRHLIIEMQNDSQTYFRNRSLFYACRGIVKQGRRGRDWRYALDAVYCINFCNFALTGKLRSDFRLMDRETNEIFTDRIRLIYIEFPFFTKTEQECGTELEQWIYILKNMETLEKMPFKNEKYLFEKLEETASVEAMTEEERERYEASLKAYRDYYACLEYREEKGRREGENEERMKIARAMKSKGFSAEEIAGITGLPIEEAGQL